MTLLIVDDKAGNITVLSNILSSEYKVKAATHGNKALAIARKNPPNLILLDVMMPEIDGYEVCRQLKADPRTRNIPVIFITALGDDQDEQYGFELGAVDYITKPVKPVIVLARVKTQLMLSEQKRTLERMVVERTAELQKSRSEIIHRLGLAAEFRDDETAKHVIRIGHFARLMALAIGVDESEAEIIFNAAPMHDVGKIGIPDSILLKAGPLTPEEREIMERHAEFGAQLIGKHDDPLLQMAATAAISHHEKWDGSGYPRGLKEEDIPLIGRIIAIADVFDALTSERPYKKAWSVDDAIALIKREAGTHFDPNLVPVFLGKLPEILEIRETFVDGCAPQPDSCGD